MAVAETHAIHSVTGFEIVGPYRLRVEFEDGVSREIDFEPVPHGELYGPLREREVFDAVRVDPDTRTLVWPNGADFDPETLHDWPRHSAEMKRMAERWSRRTSR